MRIGERWRALGGWGRLAAAGGAVLALVLLSAFWRRGVPDRALTAVVTRGPLTATLTATGTLRPLQSITYRSPIAGREAEILELEVERRQGQLFDSEAYLADLVSSQKQKEEELRRRRAHYELLREQLGRERVRVMDHLLPRRFALRGSVQVFPVAVEIRFPGEGRR